MASDDVFLGQWTNWSRGPVFGPTLTMTQQNGKYLIAFIAFFVAFVATRFWRICCFSLHRFYSASHASGAPYHQRQAILRNSSSPEAGLVSILHLYWAWRQPHPKQLLALLSPAVVAFVVLVGFTLAGVFSSQISSTAGNEVLLSGANCGIMIGASNNADDLRVVNPYHSRVIENALNYAQQCYSSTDSSMVDCNRFVAPRLAAASIDYSAACPFDRRMCRTNSSNLRIDSGYIDSNRDLGMNAAANERFMRRTVLHCAPLFTEGHRSSVTDKNQTMIRYHYGRTFAPGIGFFNYTYQVSNLAQQYPDYSGKVIAESKEFRLNCLTSYIVNGSVEDASPFKVSPDLQRPDGDTSVIFLVGNGVVFSEQTRDDWYRATTVYRNMSGMSDADEASIPNYHSDEAASPLGCVSQYQYCIAGDSGERQCGPLSGYIDSITNAASTFGIVDEQLNPGRPSSSDKKGSRFCWTTTILGNSAGIMINDIVRHLGPRSLDSQTGLFQGIQAPLPVDQWKRDVTRWYNATMAVTQAAFTNTARGIGDPGFDNCTGCVSPPINAYEESMCKNQKILSTAYASFSLFGLYFTFLTGLAIVLFSYLLEPIFKYLQNHSQNCDKYKFLEWTSHSVLQLQRQGHETLGLGTWEKCTEEVPICQPDEIMGVLDIKNETHPLLQRPFLDFEVPGVQSDKPAQTAEAAAGNDSTGGQDGGQANRERQAGQILDHEDASYGETDMSTAENTTLASVPELGQRSAVSTESADEEEAPSPNNSTAASSVHIDQGPLPTPETVEERALDSSAVLL